MSTVKERLRAVEVELRNTQESFKEFKTFCGKKFDDMAEMIKDNHDGLIKMIKNNPNTKLSKRDKVSIVVSLIMSIGSIIAAIIMATR